jgi:hypothetical protein
VRRVARLLLLGVIAVPPLAGQTIVRPPPPLDSARATLRDALLVLRDSLVTIHGAAARLQRDYRAASEASLLSRARVMRDACARSVRTVPPTREAVAASTPSGPEKLKRRRELVLALDRLKVVLSGCETEFAAMSQPGEAETVRGYANDRAGRVQTALRQYERTLQEFFSVMGINVLPLGANPKPAAG